MTGSRCAAAKVAVEEQRPAKKAAIRGERGGDRWSKWGMEGRRYRNWWYWRWEVRGRGDNRDVAARGGHFLVGVCLSKQSCRPLLLVERARILCGFISRPPFRGPTNACLSSLPQSLASFMSSFVSRRSASRKPEGNRAHYPLRGLNLSLHTHRQNLGR